MRLQTVTVWKDLIIKSQSLFQNCSEDRGIVIHSYAGSMKQLTITPIFDISSIQFNAQDNILFNVKMKIIL